jgi:hypothetical protein
VASSAALWSVAKRMARTFTPCRRSAMAPRGHPRVSHRVSRRVAKYHIYLTIDPFYTILQAFVTHTAPQGCSTCCVCCRVMLQNTGRLDPSAMPGNDRADFRIAIALDVTFDSGLVAARTVNVSAGGMLVRFVEPTRLAKVTDFCLHLPDDAEVRGVCRSTRCPSPRQAAVAFCQVPERDLRRVRAALLREQALERRALRDGD